MVRFSDLLGGNGDPEEPRPAAVSTPLIAEPEEVAEPEEEEEPRPELATDADAPEAHTPEAQTPETSLATFAIDATPAAPVESPKDVLDRLTQYATSARSGDPVPDTPEPVPDPPADALTTAEAVEEFKPVGDDLLPRPGTTRKPGRSRKRRP